MRRDGRQIVETRLAAERRTHPFAGGNDARVSCFEGFR
jgi:hypothetical protein